ncbi:MAG: DNA-binding protein WhiA [Clostridia bacterium]
MSFSSDCKKELCLLAPEKPCCLLSELSALYASMGSLSLLGRGMVNVQFTGGSLAVSRRVYTLLTRALNLAPQIHYVTHARFGGMRSCVLTLGPVQSPTFLQALHIMEREEDGSYALRSTTPRIALTRSCCMRAFLRGVLLGGGTITSPEHGYHLELSYRSGDMRAMLAKCLQRLELPVRESTRRGTTYFYLKQSDQVVTLLTAVGAHQAVMQIEDLRVRRQVIGTVNRAMNCDNANLQKQMNASDDQLEAIRALIKENRLGALPPSLQEIALARISAPSASLSELGAALEPPIGKSGVNHRMRRLLEYAHTYKEENPT